MTDPKPMSGEEAYRFFCDHGNDWDTLVAEISRRAVEAEPKIYRLPPEMANEFGAILDDAEAILKAERVKVAKLREAAQAAHHQLRPFVELADEVSLHEREAQGRLWDAAWRRSKRACALIEKAIAETEEG